MFGSVYKINECQLDKSSLQATSYFPFPGTKWNLKRPPRTIRDHPLKLIHLFIYRQLESICSLGNLFVNDKIIDIFNPTVGSSCMKYFYVDIFVFKYVDDAPCGMTHAIKCTASPRSNCRSQFWSPRCFGRHVTLTRKRPSTSSSTAKRQRSS